MPIISRTSPNLYHAGPIIEVGVRESQAAQKARNSQTTAAIHKVTALMDTGARITVFKPTVFTAMGLASDRKGVIETAGTSITSVIHTVDIVLYDDAGQGHLCPNVPVHEAALQGHPFDCAIGRDILQIGILTYNGRTNQFSFVF